MGFLERTSSKIYFITISIYDKIFHLHKSFDFTFVIKLAIILIIMCDFCKRLIYFSDGKRSKSRSTIVLPNHMSWILDWNLTWEVYQKVYILWTWIFLHIHLIGKINHTTCVSEYSHDFGRCGQHAAYCHMLMLASLNPTDWGDLVIITDFVCVNSGCIQKYS